MTGIEVSGFSWRVGKHQILKDISFRIESKKTFSIIGPSGGGKTSLLRCISGLIRNYSGTVAINGIGVDDLPPERRNAALMRQQGAVFPHLTAAENIAFGLKIRRKNKTEIRERVEDLLTLTGLTEKAGAYPGELSAGQTQRVALAMALAIRPAAILLDEPFSNLDPVTARDIRLVTASLVSRLGITAILATHDWEDAFLLGHKTALLLKGRLIPLDEEGKCVKGDEEAKDFLGGLQVVKGGVRNGLFSAPDISIPVTVQDGEYRALIRKDSVSILI